MTYVHVSQKPPSMKRCDRHGVSFNENRYNSCAVCRASVGSPGMTAGSLLLAVLGIALISFGVTVAGGSTVIALAEAGDQAVAEAAKSVRLDPDQIRGEIESLETLVYSRADQTTSGPAIRAAAVRLSESVATLRGAPQPLLERFSREITAFGSRSDPRRSGDPSSHALTTATDWETVRRRVFAEADWFRHTHTAGVLIADR